MTVHAHDLEACKFGSSLTETDMSSNGLQSIGLMTTVMGLISYGAGLVPLSVTLSSAWHDHLNHHLTG